MRTVTPDLRSRGPRNPCEVVPTTLSRALHSPSLLSFGNRLWVATVNATVLRLLQIQFRLVFMQVPEIPCIGRKLLETIA